MLVEFFEGTIGENRLVDAVEMQLPPRLGEFVDFNILGHESRYEIISVEHAFVTRMVEQGVCNSYETSHASIRCGLMRLDPAIAFGPSSKGKTC